MKRNRLSSMQWLAIILMALAATACASIGRPEGGPRDEKPPVFVSSRPAVGALNVDRQHLDLYFDENVQLDDPLKKVVVSPVQKNPARVTANGKHVRVQFQDSLRPNTTYTIDFADAIKDLNEGNILDGFATCFSTGDTIDSLAISGMVFEARTLEPAQGMLVGVYSNLADSAIRTLQPDRIARTNQLGQFSVLNLKPGKYRVFAFNDVDNDYKWKPSEDIAFYDMIVEPRVEDITVTDTLRSATNEDSLVTRPGVAFLPNDLLLTWYTEKTYKQYVKDHKRDSRRKINLFMGNAADSMPIITVSSGPYEGKDASEWAMVEANPTRDSLIYWIRDPEILNTDSLYLSVKYLTQIDTIDHLVWKADTLKFFYKEPKKKKSKKEEEADTLPPPIPYINVRAVTNQRHDVYMPLIFGSDQPIDTILADGIHLEHLEDTTWVAIKDPVMSVDSLNPLLNRRISYKWKPGEKYRLSIDSAAVVSIYDEHNKAVNHEFTVRELEEYSNLVFNITPADRPMMVEVLDKSDNPIRIAPVIDGKATFKYLEPGVVYARAYIDENGNHQWDAGNLADTIQPEEIAYYPKKISLKKNWDVSIDWNIYELPLDLQKPRDIKKNKPKLKKGQQEPVEPDEEDEDDPFGSYNNTYNNSRRNNNRTGNNRNNNSRPGSNRTPIGNMRF